MDKIDIESRSKRSQRTVGCIKQRICGAVIRRFEPFAFEDSPERFGDVQVRTVWWEEKEKQSMFLPYRTEFPHESASADACIVKDNKRILTDTERKPVEEVCDFVSCHIISGRESFITVMRSIIPKMLASISFRIGYRHPHRGTAIRIAHTPRCRCGFHLHNKDQ